MVRRKAYRVLSSILLLLLIFTASRALIRALPGNPIDTLVAESGTSIPVEKLQADLGLDRPFWLALAGDLRNALRGDFGVSLVSRQPIAPLLERRILKTLELTLTTMLLTLLLSVPLGLAAAAPTTPSTKLADFTCDFSGAVFSALPTPWIGPILLVTLGVWTGDRFPLLLPTLTLTSAFVGFWARLIRERVREVLIDGAAPGARARGVSEWKILLKYGLAPCSGALIAYFCTQLGALMAGAFVTEAIFDWPGMGNLLVDAVLKRDYPVVEAAVFAAAVFAIAGNALGDWARRIVGRGAA